jgi:dihydrofolate reductase
VAGDNSERKQIRPRKVSLFIASSLDGFIAREDGGIDWLFTDDDYGYKGFYDSVDTILMGRKTYETAVRLGEGFTGKSCYVFTKHKRESQAKNVEFASDPLGLVKKLRQADGEGIFLEGGGETISTFLNNELIDEIVLSIHPVLLGRGVPLFSHLAEQINLRLLKSKAYENGLVQLHFKVLKSGHH